MYVMTSDFGAPSQLEKIDMLDYAELVVLNKFDKRGAEDALRDVRKQWKRNRVAFATKDEDVPVYPTIASQFNDPGISWMFANLCRLLRDKLGLPAVKWSPDIDTALKEPRATVLIPGARVRYLAEIAEQGRAINAGIDKQAEAANRAQAYWLSLQDIGDARLPKQLDLYDAADCCRPAASPPYPASARSTAATTPRCRTRPTVPPTRPTTPTAPPTRTASPPASTPPRATTRPPPPRSTARCSPCASATTTRSTRSPPSR